MNNINGTVDLHTHSTFSDGTFSPEELVKKAVEKGLTAFALTDHDAVGGIESAAAAVKEQNAPVLFVPGTELSVGYKDGDIHIVGLLLITKILHLQKSLIFWLKEELRETKKWLPNSGQLQ